MIKCITTLPITPYAAPNIGQMVAPFVADVFGKRMGLGSVLSLNVNGEKIKDAPDHHVTNYIEAAKKLDMSFDHIWRDDSPENMGWVSRFFHQLVYQKDIVQEAADITQCPCGAVYYLAEADNLSAKRKLYTIEDNRSVCKVCHGEVFEKKELVFLLRFPEFQSYRIKAYPLFCEKELQDMAKLFSGRKLLISRSRASAFSFHTGGENVFLDVDFVWQLFLPLLQRSNHEPRIIVGSSKNLMACLFSVVLFNLIDRSEATIIIPPYLLAPGKNKLNGESYSAETLLEKQSSRTIRLFLASAMNWNKKQSLLDFNIFDLIGKMTYRINSLPRKDHCIEDVIEDFNGQNIKLILAMIRKTRKEVYSEELFGII